MKTRESVSSLLLALVVLCSAVPAAAQQAPANEPAAAGLARDLIGEPEGRRLTGAELDRLTEEVSSLMRCPVCQGLSVADSPTTSALAMREEARDLLAVGYTEDQVLSYFERSYGEFIRLWPKPEGFNLVVWVLPVVALLAGVLVIGWRGFGSRGSRGNRGDAATEGSSATPAKPEAPAASEGGNDLAAYAERVRREVDR